MGSGSDPSNHGTCTLFACWIVRYWLLMLLRRTPGRMNISRPCQRSSSSPSGTLLVAGTVPILILSVSSQSLLTTFIIITPKGSKYPHVSFLILKTISSKYPYMRCLIPKTIPSMIFGIRNLKYWVLGPFVVGRRVILASFPQSFSLRTGSAKG